MLDFLRMLAARQPNALTPASPLRRLSRSMPVAEERVESPLDALHAANRDAPERATTDEPREVTTVRTDRSETTRWPDRPPVPLEIPTNRLEAALEQRVSPSVTAATSAVSDAPPLIRELVAPLGARTHTPSPVQAERPPPEHGSRNPAPAGPPQSVALPVRAPVSSDTVARVQERSATPLPVIHVSIERIEVRAPATPPKATPRPRTKPGGQSLHDYLHRKAPT